jgi:hypothetical protein
MNDVRQKKDKQHPIGGGLRYFDFILVLVRAVDHICPETKRTTQQIENKCV